jgi:hypothetical protein
MRSWDTEYSKAYRDPQARSYAKRNVQKAVVKPNIPNTGKTSIVNPKPNAGQRALLASAETTVKSAQTVANGLQPTAATAKPNAVAKSNVVNPVGVVLSGAKDTNPNRGPDQKAEKCLSVLVTPSDAKAPWVRAGVHDWIQKEKRMLFGLTAHDNVLPWRCSDPRLSRREVDQMLSRPPGFRYLSEALEVEILPLDYEIPSLVGKKGLKTRIDLPANTVIGEYEGLFYWDDPAAPEAQRLVQRSDGYDLGGRINFRYIPDKCRFVPRTGACEFGINPDPNHWFGNGYMEMANDYRLAVDRVHDEVANPIERQNIQWIALQRGNEPHMMVITTKPVKANSRLYANYRRGYWIYRVPQQPWISFI